MQIKPTSLTINQLFGSNNEQYVIPTYQRRYSWNERQIWELIDDITLIENGDTHLLGNIVCLVGHHSAGLNELELVDGQQRLTTITILLECIRQRLDADQVTDEAAEVSRLLSAKPMVGKPIRKVALDSIDSEEFERLVKNDIKNSFKNHKLFDAFELIRKWVSDQTLSDLGNFLYKLKNQAILIRLDVSEAKDAFKLFETINNRGLRLSPTDIIKNFLLGNAARFGDEHLQEARKSWSELIHYLDGTKSDAFFRHYLMTILKTRVTAGGVVPGFKSAFMNQVEEANTLPERHLYIDETIVNEEIDEDDISENANNEIRIEGNEKLPFKDFLSKLIQSAKAYGEIVLVKTGDTLINRHLRNLQMIHAAPTYGFLMHLRVSGCTENNFREILRLTESFMLRRHICKERTSDNEALFARLCGSDPSLALSTVKFEYQNLCPNDDKFREEFASASFPGQIIDRARYCLEQIEMSMHGSHAEIQVLGTESVHVEHIIPQKIKTKRSMNEFGDWISYLGDKAEILHPKYVSRIGNLTIVSGALNISASNNPFLSKKKAYLESSIKLTQELVSMPEFNFTNIVQRSQHLADIAVDLWPMPLIQQNN